MLKVLALDLDGTVLNSDHKIHPDVKAAIIEVKQSCHVVLVTGRHHTAVKPYHAELNLDTPVICCNGTYIYDFVNDEIVSQNAVPHNIAKQFLELAERNQMKVVLYDTHSMVYSRINSPDYIGAMQRWAENFATQMQPMIRPAESLQQQIDAAEYVWKFVIEGEPEAIELMQQSELVTEHFSGEKSWSNRVDFALKGNNKGIRLAEYIGQIGYQPNQVMAVGDNHNDISMLKLAGLGVAMKNADDTVKNIADLVCDSDNNQGGLADLIRDRLK
ncbi:Cof-type HAD-IIB family hydrolase [Vibrio sp. MA40-2]|uniref:Cof-type HAD-IIB family hydrolase n=1 Tax=Vibrio sp. MA40-2 TaxID=3391828 RepID=UPI0039A4FCAD